MTHDEDKGNSRGTTPSLELTVVTMEDGDIDAWANSILKNLPRLKGRTSSTVRIPRVPERLRLGENDAYEPQIISFGPYHHGEEKLEAMEKHKWSYLEKILSRNQEIPLKCYIDEIKKQEEKIRSCYSGHFIMESKDFVEMMLIDGCFIVEHLLRIHEDDAGAADDDELISSMNIYAYELIQFDILLLENQLPFFILHGIFDMAITQSSSVHTHPYPPSFTHLAIYYLNHMADEKSNLPPPQSIQHLLHVYHSFCLYPPNEEESTSCLIKIGLVSDTTKEEYFLTIPNATALEEAGVEFMRKDVEGGSKLDVTFSEGKMMIPPLLINSATKTKFRNLIAFEQLSQDSGSELYKNFTAYAEFIACIVRTHKDVALLYEKGIILHTLGSHKEVADIICHVNRGAFHAGDDYVSKIYEEVNKYMRKRRHRWRASLMRNYFNSPWAVISIVAGAILLVLTLLQTYFSGYSAFHSQPSPPSH